MYFVYDFIIIIIMIIIIPHWSDEYEQNIDILEYFKSLSSNMLKKSCMYRVCYTHVAVSGNNYYFL